MRTLFKNARFIDALKIIDGDMLVEDGKIKDLGNGSSLEDLARDIEVVDLGGKTVIPGFVDMHVHFRDPGFTYKEDIESGMRAALKGGYTTVCAMANTDPVTDNKDILKYASEKANELNLGNYIPISAIGKNLEDKEFVDIEENMNYTNLFSNDGRTVLSDKFMEEALRKSREHGFILMTHCEPETEIVKRDLELLKKVGGNLHICHISKKETLDAIIKAKNEGLNFSTEVTPHHMYASEVDYKVAPPFGTEEDRDALIWGVKKGYINVHGTDHAPHLEEDKKKGAPGIDNIETAFGMLLYTYENSSINIQRLLRKMAAKPCWIMGLKRGMFRDGYDADFLVVDLAYKGEIDTDDFYSKSRNTPFNESPIKGRIERTFVRGVEKYNIEEGIINDN